jgi:hypothetical protein
MNTINKNLNGESITNLEATLQDLLKVYTKNYELLKIELFLI